MSDQTNSQAPRTAAAHDKNESQPKTKSRPGLGHVIIRMSKGSLERRLGRALSRKLPSTPEATISLRVPWKATC